MADTTKTAKAGVRGGFFPRNWTSQLRWGPLLRDGGKHCIGSTLVDLPQALFFPSLFAASRAGSYCGRGPGFQAGRVHGIPRRFWKGGGRLTERHEKDHSPRHERHHI